MGRMYSASFDTINIAAVNDLVEISPADDVPIKFHACFVAQKTDVGDANEELLRIAIVRGHSTVGTGGQSSVLSGLDPSEADASSGVTFNNTTLATGGSPNTLHTESFNIRTGWAYLPTPEIRPKADQGDTTMVVRLVDAPGSALSIAGTLYIEEL